MMEAENSAHLEAKKAKKRRSQAEKVGRLKYIIKLVKRLEGKVDRVDERTRIMTRALNEFICPGRDYVSLVVCGDEVDQAILWQLYTAGGQGLLPVQIAERLSEFNVSRYAVTRRIQRMNKRFQEEFGKDVAEKRGRSGPWAITSYLRKMWGATVEEAREETN